MNNIVSIPIQLVDLNKEPVSNQQVQVTILSGDAKLMEPPSLTSAEGRTEIKVKLNTDYQSKLRVTYEGSDRYGPSNQQIDIIGKYKYSVPQSSNSLGSKDLRSLDIDSTKLYNMIDLVRKNTDKYKYINSVLIQHENDLILESYFPFEERLQSGGAYIEEGYHLVASVSKSITSAAIGIAVEMGYIESIDDSILDYFPERTINDSTNKAQITIRNLLHMQSGLDCNDSGEWHNTSQDYVQYHLDLDLISTPGTNFRYCSGITILLGAILNNATGLNAQEFTNKHLLKYFGAETNDSQWIKDPSGNVITGYNLWLKARDMIKFGHLYREMGNRNGEQLISEEWVLSSVATGPNQGYANRTAYGFQWWIGEHRVNGKKWKAYYAIGNGGNYIINIPELKTTIVFQAAEWNSNNIHLVVERELMDNYLIPALKSVSN